MASLEREPACWLHLRALALARTYPRGAQRLPVCLFLMGERARRLPEPASRGAAAKVRARAL